ncbi:unnamed protein product [Amoebophrya sp. A25]|nr:unnamed protein product [Amoebophrya sp. A25]|eukprot:GSA25T00022586001.1
MYSAGTWSQSQNGDSNGGRKTERGGQGNVFRQALKGLKSPRAQPGPSPNISAIAPPPASKIAVEEPDLGSDRMKFEPSSRTNGEASGVVLKKKSSIAILKRPENTTILRQQENHHVGGSKPVRLVSAADAKKVRIVRRDHRAESFFDVPKLKRTNKTGEFAFDESSDEGPAPARPATSSSSKITLVSKLDKKRGMERDLFDRKKVYVRQEARPSRLRRAKPAEEDSASEPSQRKAERIQPRQKAAPAKTVSLREQREKIRETDPTRRNIEQLKQDVRQAQRRGTSVSTQSSEEDDSDEAESDEEAAPPRPETRKTRGRTAATSNTQQAANGKKSISQHGGPTASTSSSNKAALKGSSAVHITSQSGQAATMIKRGRGHSQPPVGGMALDRWMGKREGYLPASSTKAQEALAPMAPIKQVIVHPPGSVAAPTSSSGVKNDDVSANASSAGSSSRGNDVISSSNSSIAAAVSSKQRSTAQSTRDGPHASSSSKAAATSSRAERVREDRRAGGGTGGSRRVYNEALALPSSSRNANSTDHGGTRNSSAVNHGGGGEHKNAAQHRGTGSAAARGRHERDASRETVLSSSGSSSSSSSESQRVVRGSTRDAKTSCASKTSSAQNKQKMQVSAHSSSSKRPAVDARDSMRKAAPPAKKVRHIEALQDERSSSSGLRRKGSDRRRKDKRKKKTVRKRRGDRSQSSSDSSSSSSSSSDSDSDS